MKYGKLKKSYREWYISEMDFEPIFNPEEGVEIGSKNKSGDYYCKGLVTGTVAFVPEDQIDFEGL